MAEFTTEQDAVRETIHKFARKELAPQAAYWDRADAFPWDNLRKMAKVGLTGLRFPAAYGGSGVDATTLGIALEEVARFDHSCAIILCGCNITGRIFLQACKEIKDAVVPEIVQGRYLAAFASTESESGSEMRALRTTAKLTDGAYVLNGEKAMITFAGVAQGYLVLARTEEGGKEGISCLFVEADRPGIQIQRLDGFGWRSLKWGNIAFDEVQVPVDHLIGEKHNALPMLKSIVQEQRALTGLIALGTAKQALELAAEYAKIRHVYGKPLGKFEGIQFRMADDYTALEAARLVCYRALSLSERGAEEASTWSAMANLMGGETAYTVVNNAMDVYGGMGYSTEFPFERYLRDVKATQIANATLKMQIAQALLGKDYQPYA
ncbi:MAG: acyl-CoA dehydrogenase family protein [Deltaproteobacteria bacterium]|nr:acyl-CoA dehydrogenase family protein [Deltaproteobacteria bacterium]